MSRNYRFHNPNAPYFVSFAVVEWLDDSTGSPSCREIASRGLGAKKSNVNQNQFWRQNNKPIELWSKKVISQKIKYIHNNPVEHGFVFRPEDYQYSSAVDYSGEKGILDNVVVVGLD